MALRPMQGKAPSWRPPPACLCVPGGWRSSARLLSASGSGNLVLVSGRDRRPDAAGAIALGHAVGAAFDGDRLPDEGVLHGLHQSTTVPSSITAFRACSTPCWNRCRTTTLSTSSTPPPA